MRAFPLFALAAGACILAACGPQAEDATVPPTEPAPAATPESEEHARTQYAQVDHARILNAAAEPGQWMIYNGDYHEQRFSRLDQINEDNVDELGLAWYADLPTNINIEGTPLFVDGVIYQPLPWSRVHAYDAASGELLWAYDPEVPGEWNVNVCCGMDLRGLAAWEGKIIFGTLDGSLIALDAATGEPVWETAATPREEPYSITGAPRVADGKIFIGSAGGEFGVRGYLDAYDVDTGAHLWRFWTVPGDPAAGFEDAAQEMAAATWKTPGWWLLGGGGPVWDAITYDPETNLVMFGTGNGSPWNAEHRDPNGGDNLFLSSIVALDADTGEYRWHYQEVPWETWDYDAGQQLMILDLEIEGEMRHVVVQASKNGIFYVLDAATGEFLKAAPFTPVNWVTGWDSETGRPEIVPGARYDVQDEAWNMAPGPAGAHAWQGMSFSPETGLVYVPTTETYGTFAEDPNYTPNPGGFNLGVAFGVPGPVANPDTPTGTKGRLIAWDPVAMKEVWTTEQWPARGGGVQMTGGALATAGNIVFHGNLPNDELVAYRATDGERLWTFKAKTAVMASPISFMVDGVQHVAVAVGGPPDGGYYAPNGARLLVFKIGGTASIPDLPAYEQPPFVALEQFASAEAVAHGADLFANNCAMCHGRNGEARSTFPDLRRSPALTDQALFNAVVLDGALSANGMASFRGRIDEAGAEALRGYLVSLAELALAAPPPEGILPAAAEEASEEIHSDPDAAVEE
jgi:PQQ-dependent dehydrogenase (methanol/ethanol family)